MKLNSLLLKPKFSANSISGSNRLVFRFYYMNMYSRLLIGVNLKHKSIYFFKFWTHDLPSF